MGGINKYKNESKMQKHKRENMAKKEHTYTNRSSIRTLVKDYTVTY